MKLIKTGGMIFESGQAYWNHKKGNPEFIDKFWEENTSPKLHWWQFWK